KDILIYITVLAMVIVVPIELGGYGQMFEAIPAAKLLLAPPGDGTLGQYSAYATLALGSAFALFLYPHTMTGVLSATGRDVIRRREPVHAQHLPALHQSGMHLEAGGAERQDRLVDRQIRRPRLNHLPAARIRHPAAAPRRNLDQPDHPRRHRRPLYALAQSVGASHRLGCGPCHRHLDGGLDPFPV